MELGADPNFKRNPQAMNPMGLIWFGIFRFRNLGSRGRVRAFCSNASLVKALNHVSLECVLTADSVDVSANLRP